MTKHDQTILAIDPGLRTLGYAVLSGRRLLARDVLLLSKVPPRHRLGRVREALEAVIRAHRPTVMVVESIPRRPLDAIGGLPTLGRLLRRVAVRKRLTLLSYSAKTVRQTVVGNGWSGKREAAQKIVVRLPELRVYLTQDRKWKERYWQNMFDAIAIALHHQTLIQPPSRSR